MKLRYALILALLITGLIASNTYIAHTLSSKTAEKENVMVSRVIDGDTLVLEDGRHLRLLNINAPEKDSPLSAKATAFLKALENKSVEIEITGMDKYNRYLARIYNPEYINLELVSLGLASKFLVQEEELKTFSEAEKRAIDKSLGIWNKSVYFSCFNSRINEKDELVFIENKCDPIEVNGWQLKDESRKIYAFKDISLGSVSLHSSIGEDNSTDLFWNSKTDVWNNDRDSLYLFDSQGRIAHYETYSY
jgi:endonuclease YncB( thermonuclease family)